MLLSYKNNYDPIVRQYPTPTGSSLGIINPINNNRNDDDSSSHSSEYKNEGLFVDDGDRQTMRFEDEQELAQRYRSHSRIKWHICIAMAFVWMSAYFAAFGPSFLEASLIRYFHWKSAEYSYIVSSTFISAMVAPLCIPFLLRRCRGGSGVFTALILIQAVSIAGQLLFSVVIISVAPQSRSVVWLLCLSRVLIGIGVGGSESLVVSVLIFWFGEGKDSALASCVLIWGIEIGIIVGRYSMTPLRVDLGLGESYLFGVGIGVVSILLLVFAMHLETKWLAQSSTPTFVIKHSRMIPHKQTDSIRVQTTLQQFWGAVKSFKMEVWFVIFNFVLFTATIDTMYSTFTDPLISLYHFTQYETNKLWSMTSITVVVTAFLSGYVMDKMGCVIQFNILCMLLFCIGFLILFFGGAFELSFISESIQLNAVISLFFISFAIIFAPSIFSLKAQIAPVEYAPYVGSIASAMHWMTSFFFTDAVGWLRDTYHSYSYSVLFIAVVSALMLVISVALYSLSTKKQLEFHKLKWHPGEESVNLSQSKSNVCMPVPAVEEQEQDTRIILSPGRISLQPQPQPQYQS